MNGVPTMSFLEKYQIVSMLTASETNTYRAQEILTGRPVLVHQFLRGQTSPHQPDLISLVYANLPGTGTPGTEHFLDSGEDGDQVFIVTSDVPDCLDLRRWLLFIAASQAPPTPELKPAPAVKPPDKRLRGQIPSGFQVVFQSRKQAPHAVEAGPTVVLPPPGPTETARHGEFASRSLRIEQRGCRSATPAIARDAWPPARYTSSAIYRENGPRRVHRDVLGDGQWSSNRPASSAISAGIRQAADCCPFEAKPGIWRPRGVHPNVLGYGQRPG